MCLEQGFSNVSRVRSKLLLWLCHVSERTPPPSNRSTFCCLHSIFVMFINAMNYQKPIDRIRASIRKRWQIYRHRLVTVIFASELTVIIRLCCTRQSRAPNIDRTKHLASTLTVQTGELGQTHTRTDGQTLPSTLSPRFAVDKNT